MEQVVTPLRTERETEMTQIHERSTERISVESFQLEKKKISVHQPSVHQSDDSLIHQQLYISRSLPLLSSPPLLHQLTSGHEAGPLSVFLPPAFSGSLLDSHTRSPTSLTFPPHFRPHSFSSLSPALKLPPPLPTTSPLSLM